MALGEYFHAGGAVLGDERTAAATLHGAVGAPGHDGAEVLGNRCGVLLPGGGLYAEA